MSGSVETNGTEKAKIKHEQGKCETTDSFKEDQSRLNLQKNGTGVYESRGRVQGHNPIYIPRKPLLAEKITSKAHTRKMHGGAILTMTAIREKYWIPKLQQIPKRVIR